MFKFTSDKPIYIQIVDDILTKVFSERIALGDQLPSVRELAVFYTVNPNTIQKVINELVDKEVITIERGKGSFVTSNQTLINHLKSKIIKEEVNQFINKLILMGLKKSEIVKEVRESDLDD